MNAVNQIFWVWRDKSGKLYFSLYCPNKQSNNFFKSSGKYFPLDPSQLPEVTWENSPIEATSVQFILNTLKHFRDSYGGLLCQANSKTKIPIDLIAKFVLLTQKGLSTYCPLCVKRLQTSDLLLEKPF